MTPIINPYKTELIKLCEAPIRPREIIKAYQYGKLKSPIVFNTTQRIRFEHNNTVSQLKGIVYVDGLHDPMANLPYLTSSTYDILEGHFWYSETPISQKDDKYIFEKDMFVLLRKIIKPSVILDVRTMKSVYLCRRPCIQADPLYASKYTKMYALVCMKKLLTPLPLIAPSEKNMLIYTEQDVLKLLTNTYETKLASALALLMANNPSVVFRQFGMMLAIICVDRKPLKILKTFTISSGEMPKAFEYVLQSLREAYLAL